MAKTAMPPTVHVGDLETYVSEQYQSLDLSRMDTAGLRDELARGLRMTAAHLLHLGAVVAELERRGEDLSDLRIGLIGYLRQIACGRLLPEAVVRFAEYPMLMARVAMLPLADQRRLAAGESVRLVVRRDGVIDHLSVDPLKLTRDQVLMVFDRDRLRDDAGQILVLESRASRPRKQERPTGRVRADRHRGGIVAGRYFVAQADAVKALADLAGPEDQDPSAERSQVAIPLTVGEQKKLRVRAAEGNTSMAQLARDALRAFGLI